MLFFEFALIGFNTPFNVGKSFGHDAIVEHSDFPGRGFEGMEKALTSFHAFVESRKRSMFAGGDGQSGFPKDLSGTRVLFDALASVGLA